MPKIQLFFVKKFSKVGNNNGQLRIATPPRGAHTNPPGPKLNANLGQADRASKAILLY